MPPISQPSISEAERPCTNLATPPPQLESVRPPPREGARPALAGHLVAIDEAWPSVRSRTSLRAAPRQARDEAIFSELEPPEADRALETIDAGTDNARVGDGSLSGRVSN